MDDSLYENLGHPVEKSYAKEVACNSCIFWELAEAKNTLKYEYTHCQYFKRPAPRCVKAVHETKCFPSNSRVVLRDGKSKAMSDVRVGDEVLAMDLNTREPVYSRVYGFGHFDIESRIDGYVVVDFGNGVTTALTENHHTHRCSDAICKNLEEVPAGDVVPGDVLLIAQQKNKGDTSTTATATAVAWIPTEVLAVRRESRSGMIAPLTHDGTVVVDGTLHSIYTSEWRWAQPIIFYPIKLANSMWPSWNARTSNSNLRVNEYGSHYMKFLHKLESMW